MTKAETDEDTLHRKHVQKVIHSLEGGNQARLFQEFRGAGLSSTLTSTIWVPQAALILETEKEAAM